MEKNYYLYTWPLSFLSDKQKGIQSLHAAIELYKTNPKIFRRWINTTNTIRMLDGGNCVKLSAIIDELFELVTDMNLPVCNFQYETFFEDESMNEMVTCVACIVSDDLLENNVKIKNFFSKFKVA